MDQFLELVKEAKRPIFHVGSGIGDKAHLLVELSQNYKFRLLSWVLQRGKLEDFEANLAHLIGLLLRLVTKHLQQLILSLLLGQTSIC